MIFVFTSVSKRSLKSKARNMGTIVAYVITGIFILIMLVPVIKSTLRLPEKEESTPASGFSINKYTVKFENSELAVKQICEKLRV